MARWLLSTAVMALLTGAPSASLTDGNAGSAANSSVREDHGVFLVHASFEVASSQAAVMATLTDYDRIPQFMPGVERSVVLERSDRRVVVEQDAVSHVMLFSRRIHLVLEITGTPDGLEFHDRCGGSFARYDGRWTLAQIGGRTAVTYDLRAQPNFDVPHAIVARLMRRDSDRMITALMKEIASRR